MEVENEISKYSNDKSELLEEKDEQKVKDRVYAAIEEIHQAALDDISQEVQSVMDLMGGFLMSLGENKKEDKDGGNGLSASSKSSPKIYRDDTKKEDRHGKHGSQSNLKPTLVEI